LSKVREVEKKKEIIGPNKKEHFLETCRGYLEDCLKYKLLVCTPQIHDGKAMEKRKRKPTSDPQEIRSAWNDARPAETLV